MARRIVLFGASGYTGQLVAEELVRRRARPVLAGRNHQSLATLGVRLGKGLDIAVADVTRPESLLGLVSEGDVLVSTVGPFVRYGRPVVEAAIIRRARYIDSSGEPPFIRSVEEELGPMAAAAGVTLMPAAAFDYAAGDLAASLALRAAGEEVTRVDIGYFITGGRHVSAGTRASTAGSALLPQPAFRDGQIVSVPAADRVRTFDVEERPHAAVSVGAAEHFWLPRRHPQLREVNVYIGALRGIRTSRLAGQAIRAGQRVPGVAEAVAALSRWPSGRRGPDAARRSRLGAVVEAIAYEVKHHSSELVVGVEDRELASERLSGVDPYTFSARILAWEALQLAGMTETPPGAASPVEVFGLDAFRAAVEEAGLTLSGA